MSFILDRKQNNSAPLQFRTALWNHHTKKHGRGVGERSIKNEWFARFKLFWEHVEHKDNNDLINRVEAKVHTDFIF